MISKKSSVRKKRKKKIEPRPPQCGKYMSHKWPSSVKVSIRDGILEHKCLRCSVTFAEIYEMRKNKMMERYRQKINAR